MFYKINDNWDALLTQSYQDMKSNGVFYEMPHSSSVLPSLQKPLPDLSVETFLPSYNHDAFESTALIENNNVERIRVKRPLAAGDFRLGSQACSLEIKSFSHTRSVVHMLTP